MKNNNDDFEVSKLKLGLEHKKHQAIKIIIAILMLGIGSFFVYYGYTKYEKKEPEPIEDNLITEDTIFLCPRNNNTTSELNNMIVKKDDNKHESEVCDGKFVGKYVCKTENCNFKMEGQFWSAYVDYEKGIAAIYDTNEDNYYERAFLYDFKNNKKLTDEIGFLMEIYSNSDNSKTYFDVYNSDGDGVIDNYGNVIIDFSKYGIGIDMVALENDSRKLLVNTGTLFVSSNNKFGIFSLEKEKLISEVELNKVGYYKFEDKYIEESLKFKNFPGEIANLKLKQLYIEKDNIGEIFDYETGEVVKKLDKTYDFVFPLSENLLLIIDNKTVDIIDNNSKSILKEKISYQGGINFHWNEVERSDSNKLGYDFNNFRIVIDDKKYNFNIETSTLTKLDN